MPERKLNEGSEIIQTAQRIFCSEPRCLILQTFYPLLLFDEVADTYAYLSAHRDCRLTGAAAES